MAKLNLEDLLDALDDNSELESMLDGVLTERKRQRKAARVTPTQAYSDVADTRSKVEGSLVNERSPFGMAAPGASDDALTLADHQTRTMGGLMLPSFAISTGDQLFNMLLANETGDAVKRSIRARASENSYGLTPPQE